MMGGVAAGLAGQFDVHRSDLWLLRLSSRHVMASASQESVSFPQVRAVVGRHVVSGLHTNAAAETDAGCACCN